MKRRDQETALWQKKRNSLPVESNVDLDWQEMSALLDTHLPAEIPVLKPGINIPMLATLAAISILGILSYKVYTSKPADLQHIAVSSLSPKDIIMGKGNLNPSPAKRSVLSGDHSDNLKPSVNKAIATIGKITDKEYAKNDHAFNPVKPGIGVPAPVITSALGSVMSQTPASENESSSTFIVDPDTFTAGTGADHFPDLSMLAPNKDSTGKRRPLIVALKPGINNLLKSPKIASKLKNLKLNPLKLELGLKLSLNTGSGLTPASQNSGYIKGSPVDLFISPYARIPVTKRFSFSTELKILNPSLVSASAGSSFKNSADSTIVQTKLTDKRKIYTIEVPLLLEWNVWKFMRLKAGPSLILPVKQLLFANKTTSGSVNQPDSGLVKPAGQATAVTGAGYMKKIGFSLNAGVEFRFKRFAFEATYLKGITPFKLKSSQGSFNAVQSSILVSAGYRFGKDIKK